MHSKDILAQALRDAGLTQIADRAASGFYHDYLSPIALPEIALANELKAVGTEAAMIIRNRLMNGDFDATSDEADAWAESTEGQEMFRQLFKRE